MNHEPDLLDRLEFRVADLVRDFPPAWRHPNKRAVYEIACPPGATHAGRLVYSRWGATGAPAVIDARSAAERVRARAGHYDYAPVPGLGPATEWHVNFADPHLFVAYGSALFAQDEMQVAEHPALGSLREALDARGATALTVERGRPTPALVAGVERRCRVATNPDATAGRPSGLYGNAFARADAGAIRRATTRIDPPTITNLIAMAAPSGGYGRYDAGTISHVLETAHAAFRAAAIESPGTGGVGCRVHVHTGFWGCGAFGGNRILMAMLQIVAARAAGIDLLVFHASDAPGNDALTRAIEIVRDELAPAGPLPAHALIDRVAGMGFEWGTSDGN